MAVTLVFDAEGCYQAFLEHMKNVMNGLMIEFYQEATSGLSSEGKEASELLSTEIKKGDFTSPGQAEAYIIGKMKFYADAIVESYGTGSLADTGEQSYWNEYSDSTKNPNFNPSRDGKYITGRPKGKYKDIWGETRYSNGSLEGLVIEGDFKGKIKPISPRRSIQNAEVWRIKDGETRTDKRMFEAADYFFSHYAKDYFREVTI